MWNCSPREQSFPVKKKRKKQRKDAEDSPEESREEIYIQKVKKKKKWDVRKTIGKNIATIRSTILYARSFKIRLKAKVLVEEAVEKAYVYASSYDTHKGAENMGSDLDLHQSRHPQEGSQVNNPVFTSGSHWIPPAATLSPFMPWIYRARRHFSRQRNFLKPTTHASSWLLRINVNEIPHIFPTNFHKYCKNGTTVSSFHFFFFPIFVAFTLERMRSTTNLKWKNHFLIFSLLIELYSKTIRRYLFIRWKMFVQRTTWGSISDTYPKKILSRCLLRLDVEPVYTP